MELTAVTQKIKEKIELLEKGRGDLLVAAQEKAQKIAQYDCQLAVTLIKLKNGHELTLQDVTIKDPPATTAEKIAKGICWQERLAMEQAAAEYQVVASKMKSVEAELNGWQSVNRYLSET